MEEKKLNANESLELIAKMIQNTQNNLERHEGIPFLVWGYTTVITALSVWGFLLQTSNYYWNFLWFAIPLIGGCYTIYSARTQKKGVSTYIDRVTNYIWYVFGVAGFLISLICMFLYHNLPILFIILLLMGMGTTLTGMVIRFKPLILCGTLGAISSIGCILFPTNQLLIFAAAFTIMMVIPGHILNIRSKKENRLC